MTNVCRQLRQNVSTSLSIECSGKMDPSLESNRTLDLYYWFINRIFSNVLACDICFAVLVDEHSRWY